MKDPTKQPGAESPAPGREAHQDDSNLPASGSVASESGRIDSNLPSTSPIGYAYAVFPLCALKFGNGPQARLAAIRDYATVSEGLRLLKQNPGLAAGKPEHECAVEQGAASLKGLTVRGSPQEIFDSYGQLNSFRSVAEQFWGADAEVWVKPLWLEETIQGYGQDDPDGLTYREFSVLAALYSVLGDKHSPTRITRDRIIRRQMGYKLQTMMEKELCDRTDGAAPLTLSQLGTTLNTLHSRGFFARCRKNKRETFFATGMSDEQLEAELSREKARSRIEFHRKRIAADKARLKHQEPSPVRDENAVPPQKPAAKGTFISDQDCESFIQFWESYPRKVGKQEALKAFAKAIKLTTFEKITAALELQKKSAQWLKDGGQFIPYPSTWLNQRRWEDEGTDTNRKSDYDRKPDDHYDNGF